MCEKKNERKEIEKGWEGNVRHSVSTRFFVKRKMLLFEVLLFFKLLPFFWSFFLNFKFSSPLSVGQQQPVKPQIY